MKNQTHTIQDIDGQTYDVELSRDYDLKFGFTRAGCWSAKLRIFPGTTKEDWISLKERVSGAIQFSAPNVKRQSTGTKSRVEALRFAEEFLYERSFPVVGGNRAESSNTSATDLGLSLQRVANLLASEDLLATTDVSPGERRRIEKGLKAVTAALGNGYDAARFDQRGVDVFYAKATGCKRNGAELSDQELRGLGLTVRDLGVEIDGKVRRSKVKLRARPDINGLVSVSTAHNDITAVRAFLTKLAGQKDERGNLRLEYNRLLILDLGSGPGEQTEAVSAERAMLIMKYADAATEAYNRGKLKNEGHKNRGGASSVYDHVRQVPVGAVRCLYRICWQRGVRHEQALGLRIEDHLTTNRAIREAIRKSRPTPGQKSAKPEWAPIWSEHGCLFFAMEYAQKPGFDRVCPNDDLLEGELQRYRQLRREQGLPESGWLFRYLQHDRPLDANVVREIVGIAEDLARGECVQRGLDPEEVFCPGVRPLHDVRTAVINRWDAMGWQFNQNAAWLACLSTNIKAGNAGDAVYKKLNPHLVMALARGMELSEARHATGVAATAKCDARMEVPF